MNQYPVGDFPNYPQVPPNYPQPSVSWPNVLPQIQQGCICPAGANVACQNPQCPRKPARPISAIGTSIA